MNEERPARPVRREWLEIPSDEEVAVVRGLSGTAKLRMVDELTRAGIELMRMGIRDQHRDWTPEQISREVARRLRDAAA